MSPYRLFSKQRIPIKIGEYVKTSHGYDAIVGSEFMVPGAHVVPPCGGGDGPGDLGRDFSGAVYDCMGGTFTESIDTEKGQRGKIKEGGEYDKKQGDDIPRGTYQPTKALQAH